MKVRLSLRDTLDRRSMEQLFRADELLESIWRSRVARNPKEIARKQKEEQAALPSILRRQAS
jgi:hypothetical protein